MGGGGLPRVIVRTCKLSFVPHIPFTRLLPVL